MEGKKKTAAMDLVFGLGLVAFSIYVIIASTRMKFFQTFADGAGFFPMIIGIVLLVLGAILAFIGVRTGGVAELKEVCTGTFIVNFFKNDRTYRVLILLAMMIVYMYVLIGWMHFIAATAIYLFANFAYLDACKPFKCGIPGWVKSLLIAILVPIIVYYAFKSGLGVVLPNGTIGLLSKILP